MPRCLHGLLLLLFSFIPFAASAADGVLIPAPYAADMIHDSKRGLVYISTNDGKILRYQISTASFLTPFTPSATANLAGMDLTPSGTRLAVADQDSSPKELWVFEINPDTGKVTKLKATKDFGEGGMATVAYSYRDELYATSSFVGSGWVPMRKFSAARSRFPKVVIANVGQDARLAASADRKTIVFAEAPATTGAFGVIDVPTGQIVREEESLSWLTFEVAVDAFGATFAIPTANGAYVYDADSRHTHTVGSYAAGRPLGVAFHPTQPRAYFSFENTSEIRVYDTTSWQEIGVYNAGYVFNSLGYSIFQPGHIRVSANGRYLMVRVGDGVRLIDLSAGLKAAKPVVAARRR